MGRTGRGGGALLLSRHSRLVLAGGWQGKAWAGKAESVQGPWVDSNSVVRVMSVMACCTSLGHPAALPPATNSLIVLLLSRVVSCSVQRPFHAGLLHAL